MEFSLDVLGHSLALPDRLCDQQRGFFHFFTLIKDDRWFLAVERGCKLLLRLVLLELSEGVDDADAHLGRGIQNSWRCELIHAR